MEKKEKSLWGSRYCWRDAPEAGRDREVLPDMRTEYLCTTLSASDATLDRHWPCASFWLPPWGLKRGRKNPSPWQCKSLSTVAGACRSTSLPRAQRREMKRGGAWGCSPTANEGWRYIDGAVPWPDMRRGTRPGCG